MGVYILWGYQEMKKMLKMGKLIFEFGWKWELENLSNIIFY